MVLDNDEPLLPRSWHTYLVDYAVNYTQQMDQEKGWDYQRFIAWWEITKRSIQIADGKQGLAGDDMRLGVMDDQLPRVSGTTAGFNIGEDGVIW